MSDKEIINAYKEIVEAQGSAIDALQQLLEIYREALKEQVLAH